MIPDTAVRDEETQSVRTVREVARAAGVSVRTLHHYDAIGLLRPAEVGANGYRYYGRRELLRLQQILFYRELGLALADIAAVLDDPGFDALAALRSHRAALNDRIARYRDLIRTIDRTIESLTEDKTMTDNDLYAGIAPETRERWDREAREYWGDEAVAAAQAKANAMSKEQVQAMQAEMAANRDTLAALARQGEEPGSAPVQALVRRHYDWVCRSWTPDADQFAGLGRLMIENAEFRATYDSAEPGAAALLAKGMEIFAERELASHAR